jgi:hypothetical protein
MHYGRKGMKWGKSIFGDNELGRFVDRAQTYVEQKVVPQVEKKAVQVAAPSIVKSKAHDETQKALDRVLPTYQSQYGVSNNFHMPNDTIVQRKFNNSKQQLKDRALQVVDDTMAGPRMNKEINRKVKQYTEGSEYNTSGKIAGDAVTDPKLIRTITEVAADKVVPTYEGSKASTEDSFKDFIKNDLKDRMNEQKKKGKKQAGEKVEDVVTRLTNDPRIREEVLAIKEDPTKAVERITKGLENNQDTLRYTRSVADAVVPTYEGSKASTEDSFKDFIKNDLKDRANELKKEYKNIAADAITNAIHPRSEKRKKKQQETKKKIARYLNHSSIKMDSDSELYHYGIKGMKWHKHIAAGARAYSKKELDSYKKTGITGGDPYGNRTSGYKQTYKPRWAIAKRYYEEGSGRGSYSTSKNKVMGNDYRFTKRERPDWDMSDRMGPTYSERIKRPDKIMAKRHAEESRKRNSRSDIANAAIDYANDVKNKLGIRDKVVKKTLSYLKKRAFGEVASKPKKKLFSFRTQIKSSRR